MSVKKLGPEFSAIECRFRILPLEKFAWCLLRHILFPLGLSVAKRCFQMEALRPNQISVHSLEKSSEKSDICNTTERRLGGQ
jgi:hypothetical protein